MIEGQILSIFGSMPKKKVAVGVQMNTMTLRQCIMMDGSI